MFRMLTAAINKAGSTDALKVALALEGMKVTDLMGDENIMRAEDHQLLSPLHEAIFTRERETRRREDRAWLEDRGEADRPPT